LYAENIHITGGDISVAVSDPDGLCFAALKSLRMGINLRGMTIARIKTARGEELYTLINGKQPVVYWYNGMAASADLPQTGDSTPVALLAMLMLASAIGCLLLRRRSA